jgi:putative ABC transport system permease protein
MIWNYFNTALRNIKRYSLQSILNISGMAIGIASALLILLWAQNEWSFDRHYKNADNLYRIIENQDPSGGTSSLSAITPGALTNALKKDYPEIIRSTRYDPYSELRLKKGDEFKEERAVAAVDKDFLNMFDIEFVEGDIVSALNEPHNVVLTEEMAHKYFGNEDALGKTLKESLGYLITVTGVIKKPHNTHLRFDFIVPIELLAERGMPLNDWQFRCYNYIELQKGSDIKMVGEKIRDFLKKQNNRSNSELFTQNIKKIHLFSSRKYSYDISGMGDITYVRILCLVALFILIIACINFMNLSTAQSATRAKEIGLRKIAGANKQNIAIQFYGESLMIVFVGTAIALILVGLVLPGFNHLTGIQLMVNYRSAALYLGLIVLILFCVALAGSYPAFYLSSLKPLDTIKGIFTKNPANAKLRKVLVIFQFSLTVILIICTLIVRNQISYMQNKNLGFNKDNIGYFMFPAAPWDPRLEILKQELCKDQDIISVTRARCNPFDLDQLISEENIDWAGKKEGEDVPFYQLPADMDYVRTFKLDLTEGRYFSPEFSTDNDAIVINEKAAKVLGFPDPVGKIISLYGRQFSIIGVVKDFHFKPLHYKIEPLIMQLTPCNTFFIKIKPEHVISTVKSVKKVYNTFKPDIPLDFHFLEDDFDNLYRTEQRVNKIAGYFSFLAILISCFGLIALSSFVTEHRTKEIGIRKTNGAKSTEIFSLISKEYFTLIVVSYVIASPIASYAMTQWLHSFAYHTDVPWWTFVLTAVLVTVVTLLTIGFQTYKAATKNPVETLRYE